MNILLRLWVVLPHRLLELVRYQAIICDFANQFTFHAWSNYDRMFRYQVAYNATLSWNRVDDDLYNRYLRSAPVQNLCYVCRNFGHYANACPVHLSGLAPSGLQDAATSRSVPPFLAPQRAATSTRSGVTRPPIRTCHYFNKNGQCNNQQCQFAHQCRICFGSHSGSVCPKRHVS